MNRDPKISPHLSHRLRLRVVAFGAALAAALSLGLVPLSWADTAGEKKKVDASIAAHRTLLEGASVALEAAVAGLERIKVQLPLARRLLNAAEQARRAADQENHRLAVALTLADANVVQATLALQQNARDSQAVHVELGNLVRNDYQQGGLSGLAIALQATTPQDFTDRIANMAAVTMVRRATLRRLDVLHAQGVALRTHLETVRQQVAALKVAAQAALARSTAARDDAAAAKTRLDWLYAAQSRNEAAVAARKAKEVGNLNMLQAQSDSLTRVLAARALAARIRAAQARAAHQAAAAAAASRQAAAAAAASLQAAAAASRQAAAAASSPSADGGPPQAPAGGGGPFVPQFSPGGFLSPPVSAPTSSEFGMRLDPVLHVVRLHAGLDFAASCGTPVHAAADGDVIMATPESASGGYGNQLVIDHGLQRSVDLTTTYNHLSGFAVTSGHVSRGQVVGYVGTTGFSTGCHLHFETRQDGTPVNPRLWL